MPEHSGGLGAGLVESTLIAAQLGRVLALEPYVGCGVFTAQVLLACDAGDALRPLIEAVASGARRVAVAFDEVQARGNPALVSTRATPGPDGAFRLNGTKMLVLGGDRADAYIVAARIDGALAGEAGLGLFLVEARASGLAVEPLELVDGTRAANLSLANAASALRCDSGNGHAALCAGLDQAIVVQAAELVGAMDQAISITAEYLRTRKQFGQPLANFQVLQHRLADMVAEAELARSMVYSAIQALEYGPSDTQRHAAAAAKLLVGQAVRNVCGQAIQLHGGIGMTEEHLIGHYFKRAVVANVVFGAQTTQEAICAAAMQTSAPAATNKERVHAG